MFRLNTRNALVRLLSVVLAGMAALGASHARAAAPGVTGTGGSGVFGITAGPAYLNQPDGQQIYSWGYGCTAPSSASFLPAMSGQTCPLMQVPGPTIIVTEGQSVSITLTNNLPGAAGNTSILFPGVNVTATGGVPGLLTQEAAPGGTVTYTFTAPSPGTRSYYSGTQGDLQIEMGLYGALIVLPKNVPAICTATGSIHAQNVLAKGQTGEPDMRLSQAAYDHPGTCYDREYLFQFAEVDPNIHKQAEAQVAAASGCSAGATCSLSVPTEPYHPAYFLINGRSMPDDMDPNYASQYPNQPYNGNPHMHPGEEVLLRIIGQGRWQHPFHEHANHVRILGRDGNLIVSNSKIAYTSVAGSTVMTSPLAPALAGPLLFTTTTTPGVAMDGIFYFTGRGLNWDMYGHTTDAELPCTADVNGYNTGAPTAINYYEWCQDHNKPLQATPQGDVPGGGPITLPDPNILTNGAWFSGSPYLGPDATARATGYNSVFQPANVQANPSNERGYAFMWHSHNEREITTNNVFPGGMFMMMLVDSREFAIDETN